MQTCLLYSQQWIDLLYWLGGVSAPKASNMLLFLAGKTLPITFEQWKLEIIKDMQSFLKHDGVPMKVEAWLFKHPDEDLKINLLDLKHKKQYDFLIMKAGCLRVQWTYVESKLLMWL